MGGGATYARRAAVAPDLTLMSQRTDEEKLASRWLEFTFFNKGYDGRGRGGFVPPDGPSGPPSHDMRKTFFPRGAKVVSPRDGRDVVRGRTEAFHRVERCAKIDKQAPQRPRRVRAR